MLFISLLALPAAAQQSAPAQAPAAQSAAVAVPDSKKAVAVINGETVTVEKLDRMYDNLNTQMRQNYDSNGGKGALLENYIRKRLLIQEAIKSGFNKQPDVAEAIDAARESALFDRYVRDVVAAPIVSDDDIKKYYTEHPSDFVTLEKVHVRHIVIGVTNVGPAPKTKEEALDRIKKIAVDLRSADIASAQSTKDPEVMARLRLANFASAAKRYSEDASAESGGDLGWITKGQTDPDFETAAWSLKPGSVSGIIQSKFGFHLIFVEGHEAPGTEPFDSVKSSIREFLITQKAADVVMAVTKLTNELRGNSRISVFPETSSRRDRLQTETPAATRAFSLYAAELRFSRITRGWRAAMRRSAIAGPSGLRLPCSQPRRVCTLILIARANSTWVRPTNLLSVATSSPDWNLPRMSRFRTLAGIALESCALVSSGMSVILLSGRSRETVTARAVSPSGR
jgi:EpsD family peptidyl-prolyl cis-trans isomerase